MKKIGIACDDWKEPIFINELEKAGYEVTSGPGMTEDTRLLAIHAQSVDEVTPVLRIINNKAKRQRDKRKH